MMISLCRLTRNVTPQLPASMQRLHTSKILFDSNPLDSDSSSDDEKQKRNVSKPGKDKTTDKPVHQLNSLLQAMTQQAKTQSKVNVAVNPKKLIRAKPKIQERGQTLSGKLFENKLAGAAKEVAESFGGDVNKTESELLKKVLTPNKISQEPIDLSKLVMGMNIDRTKSKPINTSTNRADQVRTAMRNTDKFAPYQQEMDLPPRLKESHRTQSIPIAVKVDIDSGSPMNIFNRESKTALDFITPTLSTWDTLERREHKLLITHPPINFIEQMIRWTEQGRLWRFPVDNEQDMHIGQEEHFSEHVFLEQHLEGWCPTNGPIRHFMELVCVGLSKNPHMFAKDKKAHIVWFKEYFDKKRDLLQELGAYGTETHGSDRKQIET